MIDDQQGEDPEPTPNAPEPPVAADPTTDSHARAHARRLAAQSWAERHAPRFPENWSRALIEAAFIDGAQWAEDDWTIDRAVGQRQLDTAGTLIRHAMVFFAARKDEPDRSPVERIMFGRMAARLDLWLDGKDQPPLTPLEEARFKADLQAADLRVRPAVREAPTSNVRPISGGPLADPAMVMAVFDTIGLGDDQPAAVDRPEGVADLVALRLRTPDPRFDPAKPVTVNGYLYRPAKEK